jgi:hypothetical protein
MARTEWISLANGTSQVGVNIGKTVGNGGVNEFGDVMLIQALLNYIGRAKLRLGADYKMPDITGSMDGETYSAIGEFQIANGSRLMAKGFGWRLDPANYRGRRLRLDGTRKLMAITLLHVLATEAARSKGDSEYPVALAKMNSYLDGFLKGGYGVTVGQAVIEEPDIKVTIGRVEIEPDPVEVTIGRVILE